MHSRFALSEAASGTGHAAHRGRARLFLDRTQHLITHGSAHRGSNGAAMPADMDGQHGRVLLNRPERGGASSPSRRLGGLHP